MKTSTQNALSSCKPGLHSMATRLVNAEERFVDFVMSSTECDRSAATCVLGFYKKHKLVKFSAVGGDFSVKHGALLDLSTLTHCLTLVG